MNQLSEALKLWTSEKIAIAELQNCGVAVAKQEYFKKLQDCDCGSASLKLQNCYCRLKKKLCVPTSANMADALEEVAKNSKGALAVLAVIVDIVAMVATVSIMVTAVVASTAETSTAEASTTEAS